jgi:hypothetical protein
MADAADRVRPARWYLRAGRAAGAGLIGAAVGAVVAPIWHAGWEAAGKACPEPNYSSVLCFPVLPVGAAILGSGLVICAGVSLGFLLLQLRPKLVTIPVGCVLCALLIWAVSRGLPGGTPPAAWTTALAAGAGLASLALVVDGGRVQIAGLIAIAVVLFAAFEVPGLIDSRAHHGASPVGLSSLSPGLWLAEPTGPDVTTWRGGPEVDAMSLGYAPVSVNTLVQAATDLRPASAAALAGLGP